jgi:hypothetical protein
LNAGVVSIPRNPWVLLPLEILEIVGWSGPATFGLPLKLMSNPPLLPPMNVLKLIRLLKLGFNPGFALLASKLPIQRAYHEFGVPKKVLFSIVAF